MIPLVQDEKSVRHKRYFGLTAEKDGSSEFLAHMSHDIRMPVMNGLEATKAIRVPEREDAKRVPIIAMTANAYDEDIRQSLNAGMNAHLAKPIEPQIMTDTLLKYMNK